MTELERLRVENDQLRDQVAWMTRLLGSGDSAQVSVLRSWFPGLRRSGALAVLAMHQAWPRCVSRYDLLAAIPPQSGAEDDNRILKNADVILWRLRRTLGPNAIENVHGDGWRLSDVGKIHIDAALGRLP